MDVKGVAVNGVIPMEGFQGRLSLRFCEGSGGVDDGMSFLMKL